MKKKIVWSRLKDFRCPKCGQYMETTNTGTRAVGCVDEEGCGFWMRYEVFERVVNNLYMAKRDYRPKFGDDTDMLLLIRENTIPEGYDEHIMLEPEV